MVNTKCIVYKHGKGIPDKVHDKARAVLTAWKRGTCRTKRHGSGRGESLEVGLRYRLYRRQDSQTFMLLSHECYNKEYRK